MALQTVPSDRWAVPETWPPYVPAYGLISLWGDPSKPEAHLVGGWGVRSHIVSPPPEFITV